MLGENRKGVKILEHEMINGRSFIYIQFRGSNETYYVELLEDETGELYFEFAKNKYYIADFALL